MKTINIIPLNEIVRLKESYLCINIENPIIYRKICYDLPNQISFFIDNNKIDLDKKSIVITNPLDCDINEKRLLNGLYKNLELIIKKDFQRNVGEIEKTIFNFVESLSMKVDASLDYDDSIDISKLFSSIKLSFKEYNYENYLEYFIGYLKAYVEICDIKLVITYGLINLITEEELMVLKKEIELLDLVVLDISISRKNIERNVFTIDDEWCKI